ncbi:MAG TPA: biotin/lipoate A/B protein ligase family protein [Anaerolineales bacterium]|jgi:lipoate-protein ligase A|nr:biotin/lipoate A/B protein ligase family protein [Anaerolineales bacterium]
MATDEAILWAVSRGLSAPTLRYYAWKPGCLSLGRAQTAGEVDHERLQALGYGLVRRPSGGSAILHIDELTYSVCLRKSDALARGGVLPAYRRLSAALLAGLDEIGLPARNAAAAPRRAATGAVCFEQRSHYEMTVGTRKLLGSAQWRQGGGVLQHGSLPLRGDIARICAVLAYASPEHRERARGRVRQRATTLAAALGREVAWEAAAVVITRGFAQALNIELQRGELSPAERQRAAELRAWKYARAEWTLAQDLARVRVRPQPATTP